MDRVYRSYVIRMWEIWYFVMIEDQIHFYHTVGMRLSHDEFPQVYGREWAISIYL